ncbi:MAG: hypothetical protein KDA28_06560 [Phycisphaerales bacterium]|nr:hypothetical protein [Phycisphaerales bacterium]
MRPLLISIVLFITVPASAQDLSIHVDVFLPTEHGNNPFRSPNAEPMQFAFSVDGTVAEVSGEGSASLPLSGSGAHELTMTSPGLQPETVTIDPEPGQLYRQRMIVPHDCPEGYFCWSSPVAIVRIAVYHGQLEERPEPMAVRFRGAGGTSATIPVTGFGMETPAGFAHEGQAHELRMGSHFDVDFLGLYEPDSANPLAEAPSSYEPDAPFFCSSLTLVTGIQIRTIDVASAPYGDPFTLCRE